MLTQTSSDPERARRGAAVLSESGPGGEDAGLLRWIGEQQGRIWRYLRLLGASRAEAEDILQDVFVRVLERRGAEPLVALGPMLKVVAKNVLVDRRRAEGRRRFVSWGDAVEHWLAGQPDALEDERVAALAHCLGELAPRARRAILAHHVHGASLQEVGLQNKIGREGARALLRRARESLRECSQRVLRHGENASRPRGQQEK